MRWVIREVGSRNDRVVRRWGEGRMMCQVERLSGPFRRRRLFRLRWLWSWVFVIRRLWHCDECDRKDAELLDLCDRHQELLSAHQKLKKRVKVGLMGVRSERGDDVCFQFVVGRASLERCRHTGHINDVIQLHQRQLVLSIQGYLDKHAEQVEDHELTKPPEYRSKRKDARDERRRLGIDREVDDKPYGLL